MRDMELDSADANLHAAPVQPPQDLDTEVKVARKRKPIAKLDETLLLSDKGIPKLRRIGKERLRFKGKGHEFSDINRMLNLYQLWLDDLFPKAKFKDGLAMVEKLGHSKRLQVTRRAWINESKPSRREEVDEERGQDGHERAGSEIFDADRRVLEEQPNREANDEPPEDELDALLAENDARETRQAPLGQAQVSQPQPRMRLFEDDDEQAQEEFAAYVESRQQHWAEQDARRAEEETDEELDALMREQDEMIWSIGRTPAQVNALKVAFGVE